MESVEIETFPRLNLFCLSKPRLQIFKSNETKTAILSAPSMIKFFKTLINCLNWFSRWYRSIQTGCKQLSSCLSGVSHQYSTHFQFNHRHLWLIFEKLDIALIDLLVYTGSYSRAANSYPPTYLGCHINTAHIFNFNSSI